MKRVVSIKVEDGGDGSTFFKLTFDDGSTSSKNPDIPYDGHVIIHVDEDGTTREEVFEG
jgi:hypothetical protein